MEEIRLRSTSLRTAEAQPIVLRQSEMVRLAFLPTMVENPSQPDACVNGRFVYQKKTRNDAWATPTTASLGSLKSGEGYKLELHAAELLTLLRSLANLYRIHKQHGIPRGRSTFVKLEASLARFLALGEEDLAAFLESHREDAATTLVKLIRWLANSHSSDEIAFQLAALAPEELPSLSAFLGLAAIKDALKSWNDNRGNGSEEFWQTAFAKQSYVLSQAFAYPVVVIQSKAYVGGKQVTNQGGGLVDFLAKVETTDAVVLFEIKTPLTRILGNEYRRGIYPLSPEMTGAVSQVLSYRQSLTREFHSVMSNHPNRLTLGEPRCVIIAGNTDRELSTQAMRESFELLRERFHGLTIVTYDELFGRLQRLVRIGEGE